MRYLHCGVLACLLCLLFVSPGRAVDRAEQLFSAHKDALVQIRISDRVAGSKSSIGSGFFVGDQGFIVTNYHVVSELIDRPVDYQARYIREGGSGGPLTLLAVDVVHDLAVLRAETEAALPLKLANNEPVQGERLFSLGNPHDLGMTIVEGTYNGLLEQSLYRKIHFTGSINSGMSGGPTLNQQGHVVGVNVATAGNQLSFLVPVSYVAQLLDTLPPAPPSSEDLLEAVRSQLLANQDRYMKELQERPLPTTRLNGYQVPVKPAGFFKCWGDRLPAEDKLYERVFQSCSSNDDIYLSREHQTGIFRFRHEVFSSEKMGSTRFYRFLENHFNRPHLTSGGEEDSVTNYTCTSDFVHNNLTDFKVVLCMRAYKKLSGLYDVYMTANSLDANKESLHSSLFVSGVSEKRGLSFSQKFLEAIAWKP